MGNPFYSGGSSVMNGVNMQQVKNIYSMLRNSNNPEMLLNQMAQQNPQMRQTINLIKSQGNYEQVFRGLCKDRGINPDEFIKQMNS